MEQKIREYVENIASEKGVKINDDTDLFESGILDSLGIISLLTYLQEEFKIIFKMDDLDFSNYQNIKEIVNWLQKIKM